MNKRILFAPAAAGAFFLICAAASAHVSISGNPYTADASQEVVFSIGHGCNGADTSKVVVTLPATITSVRTMRSDFGPATIVKNGDNTNTITWTKADPVSDGDTNYYKLVARFRTPAAPFTKLSIKAIQTCRTPGGQETVVAWDTPPGSDAGEPAPELVIMPAKKPGWNKYTLPADITDLKIFDNALIVWKGNAAYSGNPATVDQIKAEAGATLLTELKANDEIWVRY